MGTDSGSVAKDISRVQEGSVLIDDLVSGYQRSHVLFAAMEIGLFDYLRENGSAADVANQAGTDPLLTEKLINSLVSLGLVSKTGNAYVNSDIADRFLVRGWPTSQTNLVGLSARACGLWAGLAAALRGEVPPDGTPDEGAKTSDRTFIVSMAEGALRGGLQKTVEVVSRLPEFAEAKRMLDLGGGHGLYAISFTEANGSLRATVFDLPDVVEVTKDYIREYEAANRVDVAAGDFMEDDIGTGYDIVFVSDVFYLPEDALHLALLKIRAALNEGGLVVLKHWVVNADGTGTPTVTLWDLWLTLMRFPHQVYSAKGYSLMIEESGFSSVEGMDISSPFDPSILIVGRKRA